MPSDFTPRDLQRSEENPQAPLRAEIAQSVYDDMCNIFAEDDGIKVSVSDAMVTVAAGRRAVQIQVVEPGRFLISFRRRHSFHMHPGVVPAERMATLVESFMRER